MIRFAPISGLLQRTMFTIAYIWYARETLLIAKGAARAT
jgi:hypothetical protein